MNSFYYISFTLMVMGIILILDPKLSLMINEIKRIKNKLKAFIYQSNKKTLADEKKAVAKRKENIFRAEYLRIKDAMKAMGKEKHFTFLVNCSIALFPAGCVVALLFRNPFLMPVFAVVFSFIPFGFARFTIANHDKQLKTEMETALSVITSSYLRNDDIVRAVSENLGNLKAPVKNLFENFCYEVKFVNPDIVGAIKKIKGKVKDEIFEDWCNVLISCQEDRSLKDTLLPIVARYTDVRIVNNELQGMMKAVKTEYFSMVGLVLVNVPLLKVLNKDWYNALMNTLPGKLAMALAVITIAITAVYMINLVKPVSYRKEVQK